MKVIFIGVVEFSAKALQKLIKLNVDIVGVVTKKNSQVNSDFVDLSYIARENNISCIYMDNINDKNIIKWIKDKNHDFIFCFGLSQIIKKEILNIAPVIGYHPAKLPQNRGRHPLVWALVLGLKKSASTFFFMDEGADSGDILSQKEFEIKYEYNAKKLYKKVTNIALNQIEEFIPQLKNNTYKRIKQDDSKSNYWRKRNFKDGLVDFRMNSYAIYNLVRALTKPYIGASIIYNDEEVQIWKVKEEKCNLKNVEPGKILEIINDTILVKCYNGAIRILEHEFQKLPIVGDYL